MNRGTGDDLILSLKGIASVLLKRFWIILTSIVVIVGLAILLSSLQTPQYEASVRMLVGQDQGITASPNEAVGLQQLTQTMAVAADSRPVAQSVINRLNLDLTTEEFFENLSVEQVSATQFIEISYRAPTAEEAQRIANATGEAFSEQISEVSNSGGAQITAVLYEEAEVPEDPVVPDFLRNGVIAFVLGGIVGVGLAFLLELLDDRWSSPEEAENALGVPVFGVVPAFALASGEGSQRIRSALNAGGERAGPVSRKALPQSGASRESKGGVLAGAPVRLPVAGDREGVVWPVGMAMLDRDGVVREADETLLGMLGSEREAVVGAEFAAVASHPEDAERHRELQRGLAAGEYGSYSLEKRVLDAEEQTSWIEVTVSVLPEEQEDVSENAALAMVKDITRLKQAEREASFSEQRLKAITEEVNVGFFTPDGYSLSKDEGWHGLWHEPGETNGESVFENERIKSAGLDRYFRESLSRGAETVTPPLRLRVPGEEEQERWLRAVIRPVSDASGGVREVMMLLEDLTESEREGTSEAGEETESLKKRLEWLEGLRERERRELGTRLEQSEARRREAEQRLALVQEKLGAIMLSSSEKPEGPREQ